MRPLLRLRYSEHALQDLEEIGHFLDAERPGTAYNFFLRLEGALYRIRLFPLSGGASSDPGLQSRGLRQVVVEDYLVFYAVAGKLIRIHRIVHGKRDYPHLI